MVWCGVVWCGVVWCGVVWCGVVWCLSLDGPQEDDDRRFPLLSLATSTVVYDALCSALFAGGCLRIASRSMRARSIQSLPNSPILLPPKPYLVHRDTLCSCEAYGMKPMYKEKNRKNAVVCQLL